MCRFVDRVWSESLKESTCDYCEDGCLELNGKKKKSS